MFILGGHYVRGKRAMALLAESIQRLQLSTFFEKIDCLKFANFLKHIESLQQFVLGEINEDMKESIIEEREKLTIDSFKEEFTKFKENGKTQSQQFSYWSMFIDEIYPILRDLTRSHREGNWELHLSAVHRSIPLFFGFDRINYSRWAPLYYEDCLKLEKEFPLIYSSFVNGGFVVKHTKRYGSGVPMDQALEKEYNKPAKSHGGIIGITRRKEAVAKWNIIKHEKSSYTKFLEDLCDLSDDTEFSLHHEFSLSLAKNEESYVEEITNYISERMNPFDSSSSKILNFVTGQEMHSKITVYNLKCLENGKAAYNEFISSRLQDKTVQLFDRIPKMRKKDGMTNITKKIDVKKETINVLRTVDCARLRNYDIQELLQYELTSTSFFLTKDENLRKTTKSELMQELEKNITPSSIRVPHSEEDTMIVIDFMAYARKVPVKKLNLKTFGDFVQNLWKTFCYLSKDAKRIDIIFDLYIDDSIKQFERNRRSKSESIETTIKRNDQPLPKELDKFWASNENKMKLQQHFIKYVLETYNEEKVVYLGGSHLDKPSSCIKISMGNAILVRMLNCEHEEADDRIMFHISHAVKVDKLKRVTVASADTDVFVCLLYNFNNWVLYADIKEIWMLCGHGITTRAVPIHDLFSVMNPEVVSILPAVHALGGCDTTSKIGTKKASLKAAEKYGFQMLFRFGEDDLTPEMITSVEDFLVKCV